MADSQSMTVAGVVAQVRDARLEDFVKEAVAIVARELMEVEVSAGPPPVPWTRSVLTV